MLWLACTEGPAGLEQLLTLLISPRTVLVQAIGDTVSLTAELRRAGFPVPASGLAWGLVDQGIVELQPGGRVIARAAGRARVWARASDLTDTATIEVRQTPTQMSMSRSRPSGQTVAQSSSDTLTSVDDTLRFYAVARDRNGYEIRDASITWSSGNTAVATVSADGLVRATGTGQTVISASYQGVSAEATVVVPEVVSGIEVSHSSVTLNALGDSVRLSANTVGDSGQPVSVVQADWSSSNPAVASVDATGKVVALQPGTTYIRAVYQSYRDSTAVEVRQVAVSLEVSPTSRTMAVGTTFSFTATVRDGNGVAIPDAEVSWSSSNTGSATVNAGTVTAVAPGAADITAEHQGINATAGVVVTGGGGGGGAPPPPPPPPARVASVVVTPPSASIQVGGSVQLTASVLDSVGNSLARVITWETSSSSIATVNGVGTVTGAGAGTARVIATSEGKADTANITVTTPGGGSTTPPGNPGVVAFSTTNVNADTFSVTARWGRATGATRYQYSAGPETGSWSASGQTTDSTVTLRVPRITGNNGYWLCVVAYNGTVPGSGNACNNFVAPSTGGGSPPPVNSVTVTPTSPSVQAGSTVQLTATLRDASSNVLTGRAVTWSSSNTGVATVSSSGLVSGVAAGSAVITATSEGVSGTRTVTVTAAPPPPVNSVTVTPTSPSVQAGSTVQLTATLRDASSNVLTGRAVTWSSSNTGVATVSSSGLVSGVAAGSAVITATSEGVSGTRTVTVTAAPPPPPVPVATVTVSPSAPSVNVGSAVQLTATTRDASNNVLTGRAISWSSSNTSRATVNSSGLVTGVAAGPVTITATSEGRSGTSTVTVTIVPVNSVTVTPTSPSVQAGSTVQLTATTRDASNNVLTGRTVTWSSGNTGVATVSAAGLVTGVAAGTATITATSEGVNGNRTVTVTAAPPVPVASVTVSPSAPSVNVGSTVQLTATTRDAGNNVLTGRSISWSSNNTARATVNSSGLVTAVSAGAVTITATSEGRSGSSSVTVVLPPVNTVTVSPSSPSMQVGGTVQLSATLRDAANNVLTGRTVSWSSSNTAAASVNSSGLVTGVGEGSTTITATSEGRSGTSSVTVTAVTPPPPGGVVFQSNWSTATGNSVNAVQDGGRYNQSYCGHNDVLSVVPGAALGWTATPNILQVTNRGETRCWQIENTNAVPLNQSYYIRFYARVEDEDQINFHPTAVSVGQTQMAPWSIEAPSANSYFHALRYSNEAYANESWVLRPALAKRTWYRFEFFVELVNTSTRRFRVWPRVYDMAGNLVADARQFTFLDGGSRTLQQFNDGGGSTYVSADLVRRFGLGYEGTGGASASGRKWYYAGVEMRVDTWPGPIQGN